MSEKIEETKVTPKETKLSVDHIIYEGPRCDKKTVYKKGTLLSDIDPKHKKYFK